MPNPNPSPATRFAKGVSGNPNGTSGPQRRTLLRALPNIRSLEEVQADMKAWSGPLRTLFESVARDPGQPQDLRLHCAAVLLKHDTDVDTIAALPYEARLERAKSLIERAKRLSVQIDTPLTIESTATAVAPVADTKAAELKAQISRVEAENRQIELEIVQEEKKREASDRAHTARLRSAGIDFLAWKPSR